MPRPRLQNQTFRGAEEWDPNLILRARKAWRGGATAEECRAILGSAVSPTIFRQRCAKLGMRWTKPSNRTGDSVLMMKPIGNL